METYSAKLSRRSNTDLKESMCPKSIYFGHKVPIQRLLDVYILYIYILIHIRVYLSTLHLLGKPAT